MERELAKDSDYIDDIQYCRERLADIDRQLGVNEEE